MDGCHSFRMEVRYRSPCYALMSSTCLPFRLYAQPISSTAHCLILHRSFIPNIISSAPKAILQNEMNECKDVPLPPESPNPPIPTTHIRRIKIVDIPPQTPKLIFPRPHQNIHLPAHLLLHPFQIPLHVPLRVPRADDGNFGFEKLRECVGPFVRTGWMA